jgi:hypothetical protein
LVLTLAALYFGVTGFLAYLTKREKRASEKGQHLSKPGPQNSTGSR